MFSLLAIEMLIGTCYSFSKSAKCSSPAFTPDTFYTRHLLHQAPFTPDTFYTKQLSHQTPFTPTDFYTRQLGNSTFHWFTSSGPLYSKTPATTSHSHSQKTSKVESLFLKNWQLYFWLVYLFWTPLPQKSGHYIPYITCFFFWTPLQQNSGHYIPFPQPEHLKSRVPFFFRKIGNSTFQWFTSSWPLYSKTPATTSHSHSLKTSKVESLFFPKNWQLYFSVVYLFLTPVQQNSGHYIPFPQPENLKSRVPFFSEKIGNSTFQAPHPIPTAWTPQK